MAASSSQPALALIQEGETVIFDENNERRHIIRMNAQGKVRIGKAYYPLQQFIGQPYGAVYTIDGETVERLEECPIGEWAGQKITRTERSNAGLFDRNTENQKLNAEDIAAMKDSGMGGMDIINALCKNSQTFQEKTEFSQEKYKRKKIKKYLVTLTLRKPTARWLCQNQYDKGPERVYNLRPDSLAMMLSMANIAAGSRVLAVDGCVGVILAAVVERLGGLGAAVAVQIDQAPTLETARALNLTSTQQATIHMAKLNVLQELHAQSIQSHVEAATTAQEPSGLPQGTSDQPAATDVQSGHDNQTHDKDVEMTPTQAADTTTTTTHTASADQPLTSTQAADASKTAADSGKHSKGDAGHKQKELSNIIKAGFTSCIIASPRHDPVSLIDQVLPLLSPSATFAVFSPWPQPLAQCFAHLQAGRKAVLLQLQESWLRPYQVLPSRTHPEMMCSGTGGFILSGIKVLPDQECSNASETSKKATEDQAGTDQGGRKRANDNGNENSQNKRGRGRSGRGKRGRTA